MKSWQGLAGIRREYGELPLDEHAMASNPYDQFKQWFELALEKEKQDPTAMVLSTVDDQGRPDSRVVLLKGLEENALIFYTNYHSQKASQLEAKPHAALNFYWPEMARQIRVRGSVSFCSKSQSDAYFNSRPIDSQLAAIASKQSHVIANREELEARFHELQMTYSHKPIPRPDFWGGYQLAADEFEFWQGRDNRLHDRVQYTKGSTGWVLQRLAP